MMRFRTNASACLAAALTIGSAVRSSSAAPLEAYLRLTDVAWASPSPDGERIAYTSEESGSWQLWLTDLGATYRRQITHEKEPIDFAQWVPNDPHTILSAQARGGNGVDQFSYVHDNGGPAVALFPDEPQVTHVFGAFSPDGRKLAFSSNRRKAGVFDVYVLDRENGRVRRIFTVEGTAYATAWSHDGSKLLIRLVQNPYDDDLYIVDERTAKARLITEHPGQATFDSSQFSSDGRSVLCITDLDREFRTIERIDATTKRIRPVVAIPHDIDQVLLAPDGRRMAYIVNREGYGEVVIADPATGRELARPSLPPSIAESLLFTKSENVLIFSATGPTFPKIVWAYDLESNVTRRVTLPNFHGIPQSSLVQPQIVAVRSFDGTMIPAWYFRPKQTGKLTVLLDIHGGPEEQDRAWFYPFAQYLASRGIALLDPNIRGSTGYGRTYLHLADGRKREDAVKDVASLHDWLVASGGADGRSIFPNGASYGGYVVLSALYHFPTYWAGGIDVYGVADWVAFLEKTAPERRKNREGVYGSLAHDREFLAAISPINHIAEIKRPLLVVGGANDPIVPILQSVHLAAELRRHGVPVELHVIANEGHGISHLDDLIAIYRFTLSFVRRYSGRR
jgi:dipeptidyl aminopeptidase/acylaminoacyl peptidase